MAGFGLSMIMQAGRWELPDQVRLYIRGNHGCRGCDGGAAADAG